MSTVIIQINGYSVKERLLEDVMFNVLFTLSDTYEVEDVLVGPANTDDAEYLESLGSVQKHCSDVRDWVFEDPYNVLIENGDEQGVLSKEVIAELENHRPTRPKPVEIKATSLNDLF